MARALYPGSFDPFHRGHLAVVDQVARVFDEVIVAVLGNPAKQSGLLPIPQRVALVTAATAHLDNVRCLGYHGLTVDLARSEDANVLVRAAHKETGDERSMAAVNEAISGIQTFFATPDPSTWTISSSVVRELVARGQLDAAGRLVPEAVRVAIQRLQPAVPDRLSRAQGGSGD